MDQEEARKKIIGRTVTCPVGHEFDVEDYFIVGVYPSPERIPRPPYKTHPLNHAKPEGWMLGASVVEERPLPIDAKPVGSPRLKKTITDAVTTLFYEQDVKSVEEYPEVTFHIEYTRDIFTKFLSQAKRLREVDKIDEAILYLISHSPDITIQMIADALNLGYWTTYRHITGLMGREAKRVLEEAKEAGLEAWLPEIEKAQRPREEPKVVITGRWRGKMTFGPMKRLREEELLDELRRILTLELGRPPTVRELEPMKKAIRQQRRSELQQKIVSWLQK